MQGSKGRGCLLCYYFECYLLALVKGLVIIFVMNFKWMNVEVEVDWMAPGSVDQWSCIFSQNPVKTQNTCYCWNPLHLPWIREDSSPHDLKPFSATGSEWWFKHKFGVLYSNALRWKQQASLKQMYLWSLDVRVWDCAPSTRRILTRAVTTNRQNYIKWWSVWPAKGN